MEVFGVGPLELLLIAVIIFVVLGPERIPGVMRTLGATIRQVQQAMQKIMTTESGEKISIPREVAELQRDLKNLRTDFNQMAQQILTAPDQPASPSGTNPPTKDSKPISTAPTSDNDIIDPGAPPTS